MIPAHPVDNAFFHITKTVQELAEEHDKELSVELVSKPPRSSSLSLLMSHCPAGRITANQGVLLPRGGFSLSETMLG